MKQHDNTHDILRTRLLARAGLLEPLSPAGRGFTPELMAKVKAGKWSPVFEECMRTRFLMGCLRYETPAIAARSGFKGRPWKIETEDMIGRIRKFQKTGNTEFLVDVANLCMIQFEVSDHPRKHFDGLDRNDTDWQEVRECRSKDTGRPGPARTLPAA